MESFNVASPTPSHRRQSSSQSKGVTKSRQLPGSACEECRRRKLRCDRRTPSCATCLETGTACIMPTSCPPRGPKKGQLRFLRERIAALESRLDQQDGNASSIHSQSDYEDGSDREHETCPSGKPEPRQDWPTDGQNMVPMIINMPATPPMSTATPPPTSISWASPMIDPSLTYLDDTMDTNCFNLQTHAPNMDEIAMPIGLHLTPLVCTDLDQLYFDRVHAFVPMIQKGRYRTWTKQLNKSKKLACLQYAMWTLAASLSSQFQMVRDGLYTEARRLLYDLELDTSELGASSLEYAQAWILIAIYEWTSNNYTRSLMSAGRAFRAIQILRLHDLDGTSSLASWTEDWVALESARRTFWVAFTIDCLTAIHGGLPLTFSEQEIRTRLPAPESHFATGKCSVMMPFLSEIIEKHGSVYKSNLQTCEFPTSSFVECILASSICGRIVAHRQQSMAEHGYGELTQEFCRRHQSLDSLLAARIEALGSEYGQDFSLLTDPSLIFAALIMHMNVLVLGEVLESMPMKAETSHSLRTEEQQKSIQAAERMAKRTMVVAHLDRFQGHLFTSIPMLTGARFYMLNSAPDGECSLHLQTVCSVLQSITGIDNPAQYFQIPAAPLGRI
ncbi:fungal-specific transcription factor domain-containing protein [Apiospora arundinis]